MRVGTAKPTAQTQIRLAPNRLALFIPTVIPLIQLPLPRPVLPSHPRASALPPAQTLLPYGKGARIIVIPTARSFTPSAPLLARTPSLSISPQQIRQQLLHVFVWG